MVPKIENKKPMTNNDGNIIYNVVEAVNEFKKKVTM